MDISGDLIQTAIFRVDFQGRIVGLFVEEVPWAFTSTQGFGIDLIV